MLPLSLNVHSSTKLWGSGGILSRFLTPGTTRVSEVKFRLPPLSTRFQILLYSLFSRPAEPSCYNQFRQLIQASTGDKHNLYFSDTGSRVRLKRSSWLFTNTLNCHVYIFLPWMTLTSTLPLDGSCNLHRPQIDYEHWILRQVIKPPQCSYRHTQHVTRERFVCDLQHRYRY
jgi:hypothetical protein